MVSPTPFRFAEFKSAYGPKYHFGPHVGGVTGKQAMQLAIKAGAFGGALGMGLMLFVSDIPRIQKDILQKIPFIGNYFVKETHPADNPF